MTNVTVLAAVWIGAVSSDEKARLAWMADRRRINHGVDCPHPSVRTKIEDGKAILSKCNACDARVPTAAGGKP